MISSAVGKIRQTRSVHPTVQDIYTYEVESDDPVDNQLHKPIAYRSVFISDVHLGTSSNCAGNLVRFFDHIKPEYLFLVGDVLDLWNMGKRLFSEKQIFTRSETTAIQKLFRFDRHGTKIPIIAGNHDATFRLLDGVRFSHNMRFFKETVHCTADGRHLLVLHGDEFDGAVNLFPKIGAFLTQIHDGLSRFEIKLNHMRRHRSMDKILSYIGLTKDSSFSHAIKLRADTYSYDPDYDKRKTKELFRRNAEIFERRKKQPTGEKEPYIDGIIHGHTHMTSIKTFESPRDEHSGDCMGPSTVTCWDIGHWTGRPAQEGGIADDSWRDNLVYPTCTALVEHTDGRLEMVEWRDGIRSLYNEKFPRSLVAKPVYAYH